MTSSERISEFFIELDKTLGPNHPFIVLHGPAYQFREWVEKIAEELQYADEELYGMKSHTKSKAAVEQELEEIKHDVDTEISELEDAIHDEDNIDIIKIKDCIEELKRAIW